jgi:hypothetical protein
MLLVPYYKTIFVDGQMGSNVCRPGWEIIFAWELDESVSQCFWAGGSDPKNSIVQQDCKWCTPWGSTQTLLRCPFLSKCIFSQYTHKCSIICAHKKGMAFSVTIFRKLTTAQVTSVQICYTKFHPNQTRSVTGTYKNLSKPRSNEWLSLCRFSWNSLLGTTFLWLSPIQNCIQIG